MINGFELVTDNINIQHFILINSNNYLDDYFYFLLKKIQFPPVPDTRFPQFMNCVEPCLEHILLIIKSLRYCDF